MSANDQINTCSPRRFRDHMDLVSVSVMQHGLTPAVLSGSAAIQLSVVVLVMSAGANQRIMGDSGRNVHHPFEAGTSFRPWTRVVTWSYGH
jgi:hypothetical protein